MINTKEFGEKLKGYGFSTFTGVPCSSLKSLINYAISECEYIMAVNEGDAVAIASGAFLGGKKAVVLMQNSGLTNALSPLTSLNCIFQIPVLGFVSLRGEPGLKDEPQHELMGQITADLLDVCKIEYEYLATDLNEAAEQLLRANECIKNNQSFFFIVKDSSFDNYKLAKFSEHYFSNEVYINEKLNDELPSRLQALELLSKSKNNNTVLLASTGKGGRELYEIEDSEHNFYMVGSMGCISSIGLGLAMAKSDKKIIAIDGDGALLMRMGSMATLGYYQPNNLLHVLLDNNTHDSTGGQFTVSNNVNFTDIAVNTGYKNVYYAHNLQEFQFFSDKWSKEQGLTFIYLKIAKGSKENLGRPKIKPFEVKERLMSFFNSKI